MKDKNEHKEKLGLRNEARWILCVCLEREQEVKHVITSPQATRYRNASDPEMPPIPKCFSILFLRAVWLFCVHLSLHQELLLK